MSEHPSRATGPVVLVGERFDGFLRAGLGLTADGFVRAVERGEYDGLAQVIGGGEGAGAPGVGGVGGVGGPAEPVRVVLGQGLEPDAVAAAAEAVARRGLGDRLLLDLRDLPTPVKPGAVHKHDPRNVLLADFTFDGEQTFETSLYLHNDNELILDHQSGPHLQGMVLVEAARQLLLAVCELEYLRPWPDRKAAFLLAQVDVRFDRPVFPLPLKMRATARRAETGNLNRMWVELETRFVQGGQEAACTTAATAVRPLERFQPVELRSAQAAIAAIAAIAAPAEVPVAAGL